MIKVLIKSVVDSGIGKLFSAIGALGSEYNNRSLWQHWGFSSIPKANSQGIVIKQGNNITCIATEAEESDKPVLNVEGDVAIYTSSNVFIKISADGTIEIKGNGTTNSIKIGSGSFQQLLTASVLSVLETATMPIVGAVAGPYIAGTFTGPPGNKTSETVAS